MKLNTDYAGLLAATGDYANYQHFLQEIVEHRQRQLLQEQLQPLIDWAESRNISPNRMPRDFEALAALTSLDLSDQGLAQVSGLL